MATRLIGVDSADPHLPDKVAVATQRVLRTFRDAFKRSDRSLSGDFGTGSDVYVVTGGSTPSIIDEFYDIAVGGGTPGYLYRTLDDIPEAITASFEVVAGTGAIPTLMIGCNDPAVGELEDAVHCIVTDTGMSIQVIDGIGGGALVTLSTTLFPGAIVIPAGRYAVSIQVFGTTLAMTLWSIAGPGASVVATLYATDSRIADFWDRRCIWELTNRSTGQKRIRVSSIEAGPAQVPGAHGALHSSVDLIPVETIRYIGTGSEPAFQNSWVNFGTSYVAAGFYKDPFNRVHLMGHIKSGTLNAVAFTLPTGYRPIVFYNPFTVQSQRFKPAEALLFVDVNGDGTVYIGNYGGGANTIVSLNGISFRGGVW